VSFFISSYFRVKESVNFLISSRSYCFEILWSNFIERSTSWV